MPLRLLRSRDVATANAVMALMVAGFFSMFFLGALYLQGILGYDPLEVGLAFLPSSVVMGTLSLGYAERLIMGIGARTALIAGLSCSTAALLLFTLTPVEGSWAVHVLPAMVLFGIGGGLSFPALMTLAMSGATPADAGLASGLVNTTVQVAGAIGLALLATVATERTDALRGGGEATAPALNAGYHLAYGIGAGLLAVAVAVSVTALRRPVAMPARVPGTDESAPGEAEPEYREAA
jgi:MFS family permease